MSGLSVQISNASISLVETLDITIEALAPSTAEPAFDPPLADALTSAGWTVREINAAPPAMSGDGLRYRWTASVEPFLPGDYNVPPLTLTIGDQTLTSNPTPIEVSSVIADDATAASEIALDRPPPPASMPSSALWLVISAIAAFVVLLTMIGGGVYVIRRFGRTSESPKRPAEPTPAIASEAIRHAIGRLASHPRARALTPHEMRRIVLHSPTATTLIDDLERVETARYSGATIPTDELNSIIRRADQASPTATMEPAA
ncbi:MAG: hypothetical protein CMJ31_04690 [Phycisphaerae bacterium]|nr:hypothetical protein [Phycisphaerae bacterium]